MRNWLTPRRSQPLHASSAVSGGAAASRSKHRHVVAVAGEQHRARQPADPAADHDDPCHRAPPSRLARPYPASIRRSRPAGSPGRRIRRRAMAEFRRGPRLGSSLMHVLRVVRVLLPVLIVAAVVAAGIVGAERTPRSPEGQTQRRHVVVDAVAAQLDQRYVLLADVDDKLRPIPGPIHTLVGDVDAALAQLARRARARRRRRAGRGRERPRGPRPPARRDRRGVAARARTTPRRCRRSARSSATGSRGRRGRLQPRVASYEHERRGPGPRGRRSVLGDGAIPVLDTTPTRASPPADAVRRRSCHTPSLGSTHGHRSAARSVSRRCSSARRGRGRAGAARPRGRVELPQPPDTGELVAPPARREPRAARTGAAARRPPSSTARRA